MSCLGCLRPWRPIMNGLVVNLGIVSCCCSFGEIIFTVHAQLIIDGKGGGKH